MLNKYHYVQHLWLQNSLWQPNWLVARLHQLLLHQSRAVVKNQFSWHIFPLHHCACRIGGALIWTTVLKCAPSWFFFSGQLNEVWAECCSCWTEMSVAVVLCPWGSCSLHQMVPPIGSCSSTAVLCWSCKDSELVIDHMTAMVNIDNSVILPFRWHHDDVALPGHFICRSSTVDVQTWGLWHQHNLKLVDKSMPVLCKSLCLQESPPGVACSLVFPSNALRIWTSHPPVSIVLKWDGPDDTSFHNLNTESTNQWACQKATMQD